MLATSHAIVGALLATHINNPAASIALSVISHPLLDLFPHWDFNSRWSKITKFQKFLISVADSGFGMGVGLLLFGDRHNWPLVVGCMLAAQWADFLEAPYHFGLEKNRFFKFIKSCQHWWHTKAPWPWGFIPQLGIWLFAIWLQTFYPVK